MQKKSLKKTGLTLVSLLIVSGFTAPVIETQYGQGTLQVAPSVKVKYNKYLNLEEPLAFAVSEDGRSSSGSFCQQPGTCKDINGPKLAVDQCNAVSEVASPCKVFAIGRDVVWNGRMILKSDVGTGPITLAPAVDQKFQKYSSLAEPLAFAVSNDGKRSSGSYCQTPGTCQDTDGPAIALTQCLTTGGPGRVQATGGPGPGPEGRGPGACKIFALGRDIIWDGVVRLTELKTAPLVDPQPHATEPTRASPPKQATSPQKIPSTPSRLRSSKAFRDLEEDIRRSQTLKSP
ncbi:MAG: hypothetical protein JKY92_01265 [Magnetovibrio sp.]|nr:hypothetical protein [Magnetovibrio sp.]